MMQQTPLENPVFVTRAEHDQLRQEVEEGFAKIDATITHLTEAMILGDDKIYVEMGRRFDSVDLRLERLEGDVGTLKSDVDSLKSNVETLKTDVGTLKTDVGTLKTDVGSLKSDVGTLTADVGTLKSDVGSLKLDMQLIKKHFGITG